MDGDREIVLVVSDSFMLSGRGYVHIADFAGPQASVVIGDRVVAVTPDGGEIETSVTAVEFAFGRDPVTNRPFEKPAVMLASGTPVDRLPAGTKIYRRKDDQRPA